YSNIRCSYQTYTIFPYTTLFRSVEEIVSAKTLGTVVHDVLEDFYKKFENRNVEVSDIDQMIAEIEVEVEKKFKKLYSKAPLSEGDRKSTRLNSSHVSISYAVFCL